MSASSVSAKGRTEVQSMSMGRLTRGGLGHVLCKDGDPMTLDIGSRILMIVFNELGTYVYLI